MRSNLNKPSSPTEKFVSSFDALEAATGMSARQWRLYAKRPGFPVKTEKGYDVLACAEWHKANINTHGQKGTAGATGEGLNAKREAKLDEEIRLLKIKAAKEERAVIDANALDQFHLQLAIRQKSSLSQKLITELNPKLEGLSAAERLPLLEQVVDEVCQIMRDSFDEWGEQ